MFQPKYTITAALLANIKRIAELVTELNTRHFTSLVLLDFEKRARAVSAHTSTRIEGNPLPLTDVKKILKTSPAHIRDSEREVLNYNQALEYLNQQTKENEIHFDLELVLRIQKTVTTNLIDEFNCGRLRNEPVFVNDPRRGQTVYWPPDHGDVPLLMTDLVNFVENNKNKIDGLIIAGIFHRWFVIIHPFIDGNGRTARLATKVLLASMNLNTFNLFSFENYYNKNITKYFDKVGVLGNFYDLKDHIDFAEWLEYFTDGIIDELLRVGGELQIF